MHHIGQPAFLRGLFFQSYSNVLNQVWHLKLSIQIQNIILPLLVTVSIFTDILGYSWISQLILNVRSAVVYALLIFVSGLTVYSLILKRCNRPVLVAYCLVTNCFPPIAFLFLQIVDRLTGTFLGSSLYLRLCWVFKSDLFEIAEHSWRVIRVVGLMSLVFLFRPYYTYWLRTIFIQVTLNSDRNYRKCLKPRRWFGRSKSCSWEAQWKASSPECSTLLPSARSTRQSSTSFLCVCF
jgi:hypothetical protein